MSKNIFQLTAWKLIDTDPGAGDALGMPLVDLARRDLIDASAPGDLFLALHSAGRLPDPMGDRAEVECSWFGDREWWYRTDFEAPSCSPGQRLILHFEGLDTFATVWINGEQLGRADNMFREWRFDITARLRKGGNQLAVCFTPPALAIAPIKMPPFPMASSPSAENKRNFMRKAQFGWGWDFAPKLVTAGIWKPVALALEIDAVLTDVTFSTDAIGADGSARVTIAAGVDAFACDPAHLTVSFSMRDPNGTQVAQATLPLQDGRSVLSLDIEQARLWWTPELGPASLYSLSVTLSSGERRALRVGIRTITLDQSPDPDEPGTRFFRFVLNGVPIFARGVNWVPPSSLVGAIDEPLYRRLLTQAAAANMNMIRVWGGGIYEHDPFYELCDELGLLVWQDFMFACAPYPEHDPAFADNVRAEVVCQVERLRHHACLALWCGNNENQAIQGFGNSKAGTSDPVLGELYYQQVIPGVLERLDPATPYRPSSPFGGPGHNQNSMHEGDIHDWTVWHGLPTISDDGPVGEYDRSPAGVAYTRYAEDMGRFISEYGIQSAPSMAAFRRALPHDQQTLGSAGFLNRLKDRPVNKVNAMLVSVTGLPVTLEEYVDFTQINQADGLKFGIEHFRRRKPHCSGSLIWQFNDCWPGISWSIVDYYGYAKASYYAVKRAYAPIMGSFKATPQAIELWVVNDTLTPMEGNVEITIESFDSSERSLSVAPYLVEANASRCIWRGDYPSQNDGRHVISVRESANGFPANQHFFAPLKDLKRHAPRAPGIGMESSDARTIAITVTAVDYLYFVHVLCADPMVTFDDNYIHMRAGETRIITATHPLAAPELSALTVRWR